MRITTQQQTLGVDPGATTSFVVDVVNNDQVIDGVTARVIGLSDEYVVTRPALLPLFPDASGQLTLALTVPRSHPAGRHPLTVELISHGARQPSQYLDVNLDVTPHPALRMTTTPQVVRARRTARFVLELRNDGNVPLDIALRAVDVDRSLTAEFSPAQLRLEPGTVAPVLLDVRAPRMFTGTEIDRPVAIEAVGNPAGPLADAGPTPEPLRRELAVRLRHRPLLSRGLLTALVLAGIVLLWAAAFLLGITKVFGNDPMTKAAPASFFAASQGGGPGGKSGAAGGGAPADALAKGGQLPAGVGGQITGTVRARSDGQPVGRILVQAWRKAQRRDGSTFLVPISSAATQTDGTYTLAGLFPTDYLVQFTAAGYHTVWYPDATSQGAAQVVAAVAQGNTTNVDVTIAGKPATITGKIDPGDTLTATTTTVTARPLLGAPAGGQGSTATGAVAAQTTTAADGSYTLRNLPAPQSYQLTFTTAGYQAHTLVDTVGGGERRLEPLTRLSASTATISGTVLDDGTPLGGATVSTTVNGQPLTITTPTTGQVGAFSLPNLPTPATYVITFHADGHGSHTTVVDLAAGESRAGLTVSLANGTGSVTGRLLDSDGHGLGGATVTVGGASGTGAANPSTTTLTNGDVGSFAINGLAAPGSYTLTFSLAGFAPATVPVELRGNGAPPTVTVHLASELGAISGVVTRGGDGYVGATVTATDGTTSRTTTSSAAGGGLPTGGYRINGLPPGTYSVTVTAPGLAQQTRLVTVSAARTVTGQDLRLGG
jgi:hypothetical protein